MHELSIALSIVEIAEQEVKTAGCSRVEQIVLEIGKLSGVEPEALDFAWPEAVMKTVLEKAEKVIENTTGKARCLSCTLDFELENIYDQCPGCSDFRKEIIQGKEIRIKSLIVI